MSHLANYKSVYTDEDDTLDIIFRCDVIGGELKIQDPVNKVKSIDLIESQ